MEKKEVLKEKFQLDGYKILRRKYYIETVNNLDQIIHYIDLSYAKVNILYHGWIGYRTNNQMKEILTGHFRDIYDDYRFKNMLTDCSKMKGSFTEINDWYSGKFMPELVCLGLKNNATVYPPELSAQQSVKDWSDKVHGFKNQNFFSLPDALNWLALI